MSSIKLKHSGGNSVIIAAPSSNPASDRTLTLPGDADGTILTSNSATGKILQVKSATKTDTQSTSSANYSDISGLSITITPSSGTKILVICTLQYGGQNNSYTGFKVYRDVTMLAPGTSGTGNMSNISFGGFQEQANSQFGVQSAAWQFLDTHGANGSTAVVYKIQFASVYYGYTSYINRPHNADNNAYNMFGSSTITTQEVAA
jgi:hypothetical protein